MPWEASLRTVFKNYGLSIVLAGLFLSCWILQTWTGWRHFVGEQEALGETPVVLGSGGYVWQWAEATLEN